MPISPEQPRLPGNHPVSPEIAPSPRTPSRRWGAEPFFPALAHSPGTPARRSGDRPSSPSQAHLPGSWLSVREAVSALGRRADVLRAATNSPEIVPFLQRLSRRSGGGLKSLAPTHLPQRCPISGTLPQLPKNWPGDPETRQSLQRSRIFPGDAPSSGLRQPRGRSDS